MITFYRAFLNLALILPNSFSLLNQDRLVFINIFVFLVPAIVSIFIVADWKLEAMVFRCAAGAARRDGVRRRYCGRRAGGLGGRYSAQAARERSGKRSRSLCYRQGE